MYARSVPHAGTFALVLDTNQVQRDWFLAGAPFVLMRYMVRQRLLTVHLPAVAVEELVANYGRKLLEADITLRKLNRTRAQLGMQPLLVSEPEWDYRSFLHDFIRTSSDHEISPFPPTSHADVVARAVARRSPFDEKGGGYRDTLIWETALGLAARGRDVALASADSAFGREDSLHPALIAEAADLPGSVQLVTDLSTWLLGQLPWSSDSPQAAIAEARDREFQSYFDFAGFDQQIAPDVETLSDALGLPRHRTNITGLRLDGSSERVEERDAESGATWVVYRVGMQVQVATTLDEGQLPADADWTVVARDASGAFTYEGTVYVLADVGVFYAGDEDGLEAVSYEISPLPFEHGGTASAEGG